MDAEIIYSKLTVCLLRGVHKHTRHICPGSRDQSLVGAVRKKLDARTCVCCSVGRGEQRRGRERAERVKSVLIVRQELLIFEDITNESI